MLTTPTLSTDSRLLAAHAGGRSAFMTAAADSAGLTSPTAGRVARCDCRGPEQAPSVITNSVISPAKTPHSQQCPPPASQPLTPLHGLWPRPPPSQREPPPRGAVGATHASLLNRAPARHTNHRGATSQCAACEHEVRSLRARVHLANLHRGEVWVEMLPRGRHRVGRGHVDQQKQSWGMGLTPACTKVRSRSGARPVLAAHDCWLLGSGAWDWRGSTAHAAGSKER
jgi:hypothetical protein